MTNFEIMTQSLRQYLSHHGISMDFISNLHDTSLNDTGCNHIYKGDCDFDVISMDAVAKDGYKIIKQIDPNSNPITTTDAFLINEDNEWFFIEFKDSSITGDKKGLKDNIIKKAYESWYMLLNVLYYLREHGESCELFDDEDPVKFAKEHVTFILVCSFDKNLRVYDLAKDCIRAKKHYTPLFMMRLKEYLFKDAYVYTENLFEREFVSKFSM